MKQIAFWMRTHNTKPQVEVFVGLEPEGDEVMVAFRGWEPPTRFSRRCPTVQEARAAADAIIQGALSGRSPVC